ncbi:hypothetical protein HED55_08220 [Ochrobactrum haematophilum]|uniref:Uncharacterized protein n=1 Tax=Brucella haematophila TaxID=419474 RepID=A0ABX1DK47_9HYPH|nr:hypothetical protein [Brucella haematophila]
MKLTEEDRKFLSCLKSDGGPTGSWSIPTATRAQDRARTRAKNTDGLFSTARHGRGASPTPVAKP